MKAEKKFLKYIMYVICKYIKQTHIVTTKIFQYILFMKLLTYLKFLKTMFLSFLVGPSNMEGCFV